MHGLVAIFLSATNMPVPLVSCFTFRPSRISEAWRGAFACALLILWEENWSIPSLTLESPLDSEIRSLKLTPNVSLKMDAWKIFILFFLGQMDYFQRRCLLVLQNVIPTLPTFWPIKAPLYHCTARKPWSIIVEALRGVEWGGRCLSKISFKNIPAKKTNVTMENHHFW